MFKQLKNQRGQVTILVILVFIILCGFAGFAIDVGTIIYTKHNLQNSLDITTLATVQEVINTSDQVQNTAIYFAEKNGIHSNQLTITYPYNGDNYKVELTAKKTINLMFLPILGVPRAKTISVRAVGGAEVDTLTLLNDIALNYAVFSGSSDTNLDIKGNSSSIYGNIHGNDDVEFFGNNHYVDGNITADEDIRYADKATITGTVQDWDQILPMPSIDFNKYADHADYVVNGDVLYNGDLNIDGIWLINGNCHLAGQRISGKGILLVTGSLTISGGTEYASADDLLAIHVGIDIHVSAANSNIVGALFAPNGEIRINGSGNTFHGALIADKVVWASYDTTIDGVYDNRVTEAFDVEMYVFRLIE